MLVGPEPLFASREAFARASLEHRRLGYLGWALGRAELHRLTDDTVLARAVDLDDPGRQAVLDELQRRLERWPLNQHRALVERLRALAWEHDRPGRSAQRVDRLLERFVHRAAPEAAHVLAHECARSYRLARRRAGWRHYRRHGVPAEAASWLAEDLERTAHPDLAQLAAVDGGLLAEADILMVLASLNEFYWRGRALATGFAFGLEIPAEVIDRYPAEALFGIRRAGRRDALPLVRRIIDRHGDETEVITEAIRAFMQFGARRDLEAAMRRGGHRLETTDNPFYLALSER